MITFVTGKPGDGKSMYGMSLIVESLLNSDRIIATNIALKLPELRAYLMLRGWKPKPGDDINERVILLDNEDVFEFYRHRSGGYMLPPSPDFLVSTQGEDEEGKKLKKMTRYNFLRYMTAQMREMKRHKRALRAVEYHIDEAHDYFSAREWTNTGRGILWYASKHRHLHDEIVFYTQVMANVEGQLRGLASFTVRARNQIRMRWGPFRKAPIFRLYHYYGGPEDTDKAVPFNKGVMQLDAKGLCRTYNSAGALSVHDKPEEVKNKAPLPYWALPVVGACAVLAVVTFMALMPLIAGKLAGSRIKASASEAGKALGVPVVTAPVVQAAPPEAAPAPARAGFGREGLRKQFGGGEEVELLDGARVNGVMAVGGTVLVHVEGNAEWSAVRMYLGGGLVELGNGVVVRKSEIDNARKAPKTVKEGPNVQGGHRNTQYAAAPRKAG